MILTSDVITAFLDEAAKHGIAPVHGSTITVDGALHRYKIDGDKRHDSGWYVLFDTEPGGGAFGSWKHNVTASFCLKRDITPEARAAFSKKIEETRAASAAEREAKADAAAETAAIVWDAATEQPSHPYCDRKNIQPIGARVGSWPGYDHNDALIIPVRSGKQLKSLQAIFPDGKKLFLPGGAIKGNYAKIDGSDDAIVLCEGYATGVSIHMATGYTVIVAFSASNLKPVAEKIARAKPECQLIIAADSDPNGVGLQAAKDATEHVQALILPSPVPTDFNDLHVYHGLQAVRDVFMPPVPTTEPAQPSAPSAIQSQPDDLLLSINKHSFPFPQITMTGQNKPKACLPNLRCIIETLGITIRYNVIKKDVEILIPGRSYSVDNHGNAALAFMRSVVTQADMSTAGLESFILELADHNQYNPVATWIESRPWDGQDRIDALSASLGSKHPELTQLLLTRWLVGAIEAAYSPHGIDNSSVLVLQGEQYAGKTAWIKSLLGPHFDTLGKEGLTLNPADKDSVMGAIQYWIVELGELDATFRKADIAALKGFITKQVDEVRRPYAAQSAKYPRRTVFAASVNPLHYLHDDQNRRFWTVECGPGLNPAHGIDMQQLWAQVRHLHLSGLSWRLTRDELAKLNTHNDSYKTPDPMEEILLSRFDASTTVPRPDIYTASEVLLIMGYDRPTNAQAKTIGQILRQHFGQPHKSSGRLVFHMPSPKP